MQATILTKKEKESIEIRIQNAKGYLQEIIDRAIEEGKTKGVYAPGFDYPASQAAFAGMELDEILKIIE